MAKLHELLAAEKTPTAAWNQVREETLQKLKNPQHYFEGHTRSLAMVDDSPANKAVEDAAREDKPVTTTVYDTLSYALGIWARAEDLQYQKNATNRKATGTVNFEGQDVLTDMPVDELLGLEARLTKIREVIAAVPTLDATRDWKPSDTDGRRIWVVKNPEHTVKTEKVIQPIVMSPATKEHPAQVQAVGKDLPVGKFTVTKRSGAATALQKAEAIKRIDMLIEQVKRARMRANEQEVEKGRIGAALAALILEPFALETEGHQ